MLHCPGRGLHVGQVWKGSEDAQGAPLRGKEAYPLLQTCPCRGTAYKHPGLSQWSQLQLQAWKVSVWRARVGGLISNRRKEHPTWMGSIFQKKSGSFLLCVIRVGVPHFPLQSSRRLHKSSLPLPKSGRKGRL